MTNNGNSAILAGITAELARLTELVRDNRGDTESILTAIRRIEAGLREHARAIRDEITHHSDSAVDMDTYGHDVLVLKGDHDRILKIVTEIYERKRFSRQIIMTIVKWVFGAGGGMYLLAEILEQASARFP